jgi:hypothetical protein
VAGFVEFAADRPRSPIMNGVLDGDACAIKAGPGLEALLDSAERIEPPASLRTSELGCSTAPTDAPLTAAAGEACSEGSNLHQNTDV